MEPLGIYIHVPFCVRKCLYCDFVSYGVGRALSRMVDDYVAALEKEIKIKAAKVGQRSVKSIFFGGGTPSLLPSRLIGQIIDAVSFSFDLKVDAEITLEANPGTVTRSTLKELRSLGINRLSLGVQSFNNVLLRRLGRIHTAAEAIVAYQDAREAGFENINLDLMYGIPGQTLKDWLEGLELVIELQPEHVAAYSLIVEEGTPFGQWYERGILDLPSEDDTADMMEVTQMFMEAEGWQWYEISNFARPGFECVHNRIYWKNQEYLGFGAAAYSYLGGVRSANASSLSEYLEKVNAGVSPVVSTECLDRLGQMGETIMLGLRLREGVNLEEFHQQFGVDLLEEYRTQVEKLQDLHLLEIVERRRGDVVQHWMRLTVRGVEVANRVMAEFIA